MVLLVLFSIAEEWRRKSRRLAANTYTPSGAYLVLQLHDELIYEVCHHKISVLII